MAQRFGIFLSHLAVEREIEDVELGEPATKHYVIEAFKEILFDREISEG